MQLADVTRSLRNHWLISVLILLLSGTLLAAFLFTRSEVQPPDKWVSTVKVLIPAITDKGERPEGVPPVLLQGQEAVALSSTVRNAALTAIGANQDSSRFGFSYSTSEQRDVASLTVTAPERDRAIALADAYADAYISTRGRIVADSALADEKGALNSLEQYRARLKTVEADLRKSPDWFAFLRLLPEPADELDFEIPRQVPSNLALLFVERRELISRVNESQLRFAESSAETVVPKTFAQTVERPLPIQVTPALPSPVQPALVALGVGMLLALAVPILMDQIDHSIRDAKSVTKAFDTPLLSAIPASARRHQFELAVPGTKADAAYRTLAAASIATDKLPRSIVVTSPTGDIQDGVAANFAAALAGLGLKVALVPTQDRQSWFLDLAELKISQEFPNVLALAQAGKLNGQVSESLLPTATNNLWVLANGAANDDALVEGMPGLLESLAHSDIDVTVIAGPALLEDPAATILAWSTRSVLWVVESGKVTEHEAREASNRLGLAGAAAFGVTLIDAKN